MEIEDEKWMQQAESTANEASKFAYDDEAPFDTVAIEGEDEAGAPRIAAPPPPENVEEEKPKKVMLDYESFFQELFLEVYDIEHGFDKAVEKYTEVLVSRGIRVNPQLVYNQIEMMLSRVTKIYIVKRLCPALGLISEQDLILQNELELMYKTPMLRQQPPKRKPSKLVGEADDSE